VFLDSKEEDKSSGTKGGKCSPNLKCSSSVHECSFDLLSSLTKDSECEVGYSYGVGIAAGPTKILDCFFAPQFILFSNHFFGIKVIKAWHGCRLSQQIYNRQLREARQPVIPEKNTLTLSLPAASQYGIHTPASNDRFWNGKPNS
jgi:hypothetical protein